jgi:hypothetical protein
MKINDLILHGYAKKDGENGWYAICLELNLLAQGDNEKHAIEKLKSMIDDYVLEAFTIDRKNFKELMSRKAPVYFYLQYYWIVIKNKFHSTLHQARYSLFEEPIPLPHYSHGR